MCKNPTTWTMWNFLGDIEGDVCVTHWFNFLQVMSVWKQATIIQWPLFVFNQRGVWPSLGGHAKFYLVLVLGQLFHIIQFLLWWLLVCFQYMDFMKMVWRCSYCCSFAWFLLHCCLNTQLPRWFITNTKIQNMEFGEMHTKKIVEFTSNEKGCPCPLFSFVQFSPQKNGYKVYLCIMDTLWIFLYNCFFLKIVLFFLKFVIEKTLSLVNELSFNKHWKWCRFKLWTHFCLGFCIVALIVLGFLIGCFFQNWFAIY